MGDVIYTSITFFLTCITLLCFSIEDLLIFLAGWKALLVQGVESHVADTRGAVAGLSFAFSASCMAR